MFTALNRIKDEIQFDKVDLQNKQHALNSIMEL